MTEQFQGKRELGTWPNFDPLIYLICTPSKFGQYSATTLKHSLPS